MVFIVTWFLALSKIKIHSNMRGDPIKSLLYMPGGHSMTIKFPNNMLGGPIGSPINMPTILGRTIKVLQLAAIVHAGWITVFF